MKVVVFNQAQGIRKEIEGEFTTRGQVEEALSMDFGSFKPVCVNNMSTLDVKSSSLPPVGAEETMTIFLYPRKIDSGAGNGVKVRLSEYLIDRVEHLAEDGKYLSITLDVSIQGGQVVTRETITEAVSTNAITPVSPEEKQRRELEEQAKKIAAEMGIGQVFYSEDEDEEEEDDDYND